jgi:transposase
MLSLSGASRIFLYDGPTDMRKGFDGLTTLIESSFPAELTSGAAFVFFNTRKTLVKVMQWDGDGFAIWYKRLEKGTFAGAFNQSGPLTRRELSLILEGVVVKRLYRRFSL